MVAPGGVVVAIAFIVANTALVGDKFVALGWSSARGVYYPFGKGVCSLINENRDNHLVRCQVYETGGSIYNIQALRSGELDVAITRADLAYLAAKGEGVFKSTEPMAGLQIIASLYDNPVGIIVKNDSKFNSVEDIPGSRINIGNLGSGKRDFSDLLFKVMGWKKRDFLSVGELSTSKMGKAFCAGEVDVLIQAMGIPAKFYDDMIHNCDGRFVPITEDVLTKLNLEAPFLEATVIPGGMYRSNPEVVRTIGTKAVLVTIDRVDPNTIYQICSALFSKIERLREQDVSLQNASVKAMANEGVYIPFHLGATQYFNDNAIGFRQVDTQK